MSIPEVTTLSEGAAYLYQMRRWKPFRFGGKWFLAKLGDEIHAFRSKAPILSQMKKRGLTVADTAIIS